MTLYDLKQGEKAIIIRINGHGSFKKRITEMGFIAGKEVHVIKKAPLRGPVEYSVMGYQVSLRLNDALMIDVSKEPVRELSNGNQDAFRIDKTEYKPADNQPLRKQFSIALVGNPNSGKTSIFNFASHSKEHVANYGGVTVELKKAKILIESIELQIVDLPGTYSFTTYTPEEVYVRNYLITHKPDFVINVIDASNLERNLYLTTQLLDMGVKVVIALNMYDELRNKGDKFDHVLLAEMLGIPIIPTIGTRGEGVEELFRKVAGYCKNGHYEQWRAYINYGTEVENSIRIIENTILNIIQKPYAVPSRFIAIKLLEKDYEILGAIKELQFNKMLYESTAEEIKKLETAYANDTESVIADIKYGFIAGALKETYQVNNLRKNIRTETEVIDTFMTHRVFGFPVFLFIIWAMFQSTFMLGNYPKSWIESMIRILQELSSNIIPPGIAKDFINEAVIGGMGGILVFVPNILILYFFISLMEDTGYMARAVFIMDKLMHKIGLHGKSFIPLIMGFGCNVPAIMATRTLKSKSDRIITMLINPFMSCSARLPVYILIIGAFFPDNGGLVLFSIYAGGILLAIISAIFFRKILFKTADAPFVMELPPYRFPTFRALIRNMWFKTYLYLKKIGGVILVASIIIWAASYFSLKPGVTKETDRKIEEVRKLQKIQHNSEAGKVDRQIHLVMPADTLDKLFQDKEHIRLETSLISYIGKAVEPIMMPLGFDWKMSVSLLAGIAGKEIVVSTLGIIYQADHDKNDKNSLTGKLKSQTHTSGRLEGKKVFSKPVALAFIVFILVYFPCIAVTAVVKNESGHWKWAAFLIIYTTTLAWVIAFAVKTFFTLAGL